MVGSGRHFRFPSFSTRSRQELAAPPNPAPVKPTQDIAAEICPWGAPPNAYSGSSDTASVSAPSTSFAAPGAEILDPRREGPHSLVPRSGISSKVLAVAIDQSAHSILLSSESETLRYDAFGTRDQDDHSADRQATVFVQSSIEQAGAFKRTCISGSWSLAVDAQSNLPHVHGPNELSFVGDSQEWSMSKHYELSSAGKLALVHPRMLKVFHVITSQQPPALLPLFQFQVPTKVKLHKIAFVEGGQSLVACGPRRWYWWASPALSLTQQSTQKPTTEGSYSMPDDQSPQIRLIAFHNRSSFLIHESSRKRNHLHLINLETTQQIDSDLGHDALCSAVNTTDDWLFYVAPLGSTRSQKVGLGLFRRCVTGMQIGQQHPIRDLSRLRFTRGEKPTTVKMAFRKVDADSEDLIIVSSEREYVCINFPISVDSMVA